MVNPMVDTLTMDFPFVCDLPKREVKALRTAWDEMEEFKLFVRERGAVVPVTFAACLLGVSRQWIHDLISRGKLRTVDLGKFRFIEAESITEWAKEEHKAGRPIASLAPGNNRAQWQACRDYGNQVMRARPGRPKKSRK